MPGQSERGGRSREGVVVLDQHKTFEIIRNLITIEQRLAGLRLQRREPNHVIGFMFQDESDRSIAEIADAIEQEDRPRT
jgi:hypothetical protein